MAGKFSFSANELGRLKTQMSLSHNACPICGNPVMTVKTHRQLEQRCAGCNWEGPAVTESGIKSFDDNYY